MSRNRSDHHHLQPSSSDSHLGRVLWALSRAGFCCALLLAVVALAPAAVAQSPLPGFSKSFSPSTIGPGGVTTLRFDITNSSSVGVRNLDFTDNLPAGMTIANPPSASTTCAGGSVSAPAGGGTITFSGGGVGASGSCFVRVNVTSSTPGTHTNVSGDLTSDAGNSGNATADLTVATDRPGFTKSFSPATVVFGGRSTLTFTIDNSANSQNAANLRFTDTLPSGMVIAGPTNATTTCSGGTLTATVGGSTIAYAPLFFGDAVVSAGSVCTVSVDVVGNAVGTLANVSGELTSTPPLGSSPRSSGKASAVLTVNVEKISLIKSFTDDPVPPGGTVTLQFTIRNLDRDFEAINIAFTDDLDATLSGLVAVALPSNPCGSGSSLSGTSMLSLTGGNLPAEGICTFSVTLAVPSGASPGSYTNTTSEITADVGGRPTTGSAATDVLSVAPIPSLTKEFTDDPVGGGGTVTLKFTITNTSPDQAATDIAFTDVLDNVLPTASSVPPAMFCGAGATATFIPLGVNPAQIIISGASLAKGDSCTFSFTLDVLEGASGGTYPNTTSEITATVGGVTYTGDPASDDLVVVEAPALSKEFTDDPAAPGDTVTLEFTLVHDELAPGDATGITFTDDLDAALSGLESVSPTQTDVCGTGSSISGTMTLLFTGGSLAPGESCTFSVTLQVPSDAPVGSHTNTTSAVVATVLGVGTTSLAATDDLTIAGLELTKEFVDDPTLAGDTVTLRFTLNNQSPISSITGIQFSDDLDDNLSGLAATVVPAGEVCGTGSSITATSGGTFLNFSGGSLGPGASCSFDVTLTVPIDTEAGDYVNATSSVTGTVDGSFVVFGNATDVLTVVADFLMLTKEFIDDPVSPGDPVTLRFTLTNLVDSATIDSITFTDDLDAALTGLVSSSGTLTDVCGTGSGISGTGVLTFSGGSLGPGASCSFDVTLTVPGTVTLGTVATNTTSVVSGSLGGAKVQGDPATDTLRIDFVSFAKTFSGDAEPGDIVTLTFSIQNLSATDTITDLSFSDDLDAVLSGLVALGLPEPDVCGEGSVVDGTSFLTVTGASLLPGGSCTFSVDVQVPVGAEPGSYLNVTSDLLQFGIRVTGPATATLTVIENVDDDNDGVLNGADVCPDTVIPEGVPTVTLKPNRYALVDGDLMFDTVVPPGGGPGDVFTTTDTAGCSCEQIIDELGLGKGHTKFGCSVGAMRNWVKMVTDAARAQRVPPGAWRESR